MKVALLFTADELEMLINGLGCLESEAAHLTLKENRLRELLEKLLQIHTDDES